MAIHTTRTANTGEACMPQARCQAHGWAWLPSFHSVLGQGRACVRRINEVLVVRSNEHCNARSRELAK
jgi:hypothetical protein